MIGASSFTARTNARGTGAAGDGARNQLVGDYIVNFLDFYGNPIEIAIYRVVDLTRWSIRNLYNNSIPAAGTLISDIDTYKIALTSEYTYMSEFRLTIPNLELNEIYVTEHNSITGIYNSWKFVRDGLGDFVLRPPVGSSIITPIFLLWAGQDNSFAIRTGFDPADPRNTSLKFDELGILKLNLP